MKIKMGEMPLVYPVPIVLAGANVKGKPNYVTLGDLRDHGDSSPRWCIISLHREHFTTQGVLENKTFSVNLPSTDMLEVTDYCGIVSGRDVDKGALFESFYGELETAPMIADCPVNLECRMVHEFSIEHRQIFVGWVVQAHVDEAFVIQGEGRPKIAPLP